MFLFSRTKAKKEGVVLFNPTFARALKSLFVPIFAGGVFSLFLIHHEVLGLVAPVTLIFYGLGFGIGFFGLGFSNEISCLQNYF